MCKNIFQIITLAITVTLPIKKSHAEYFIKHDKIYTTSELKKYCRVFPAPKLLKISRDKNALILSETGYLPINLLESCPKTIITKNIPKGVGILTDINLKKRIYIALDFVSTQPLGWLATVAKIGSKNNLITQPGAYNHNKNTNTLQEQAFSSTADIPDSIISPDGKFVAPSGEIDCSENSYPGVWEIEKDKRIIASESACQKLFKNFDK